MPSSDTKSELAPLDLSRFFESHPRLETERLLLRQITIEDAEHVFAYGSDSETTKYMIFPTHRTIDDSLQWLQTLPGLYERKERIAFAITLKNGTFIGGCNFHNFRPQHHSAMLGYIMNRNYWGRGYMTEAVGELIRFGFAEMEMRRISAHCDFENIRSARVLERCGMKLEGVLEDYELRRGVFVSTKSYAIIRGN
jgi:ribosomal-protein-alanine N-acetyltransferase